MKSAVIAISGSQYQIQEEQILTINNLGAEEKENRSTDQVLLLIDQDKTQVGTPLVKNAVVEYQVIKNYQGKKLRVFKYKAKSRYRKTRGFRPQLADIKITQISIEKPEKDAN